jgi:hypothetical protein
VSLLKSEAQVIKVIGDKKMIILTLEQGARINYLIDSLENQHIIKDSLIKITSSNLQKLSNNLIQKSDSVKYYQSMFIHSIDDMQQRNARFNAQIKVARNKHTLDQVTLGLVSMLVFFLFTKTYK